ncbi:hypothetical protein [Bacillus cereus]|uniref:hypothetical protein n=1 Tax=Bacillus cereus TaxID=1396 RepID=UPI00062CF725|nr:hypothetical protein [Bacillus cereus]KLA29142.1 hypothetical protein B4080_6322 [Bacillus cereus]
MKHNKQKRADGRTVTPKYSSYEERLKVSNRNHGEWEIDRRESKFISNKGKVKKYLDEIKVDGHVAVPRIHQLKKNKRHQNKKSPKFSLKISWGF